MSYSYHDHTTLCHIHIMITPLYVIFISWSHYSTSYLYRDYTTFCDVYTMITLPCAMFIPWSHYLLSYLHQSHYHTLYSCCVHTTLCHIIPWSHYILPYWYNGHTALCHVHTMITLRSVKFILVTPPHALYSCRDHTALCHVIPSPCTICMRWSHHLTSYSYLCMFTPYFSHQRSSKSNSVKQKLLLSSCIYLHTLCFSSSSFGPTPDNSKRCGELIAPADSITSLLAKTS